MYIKKGYDFKSSYLFEINLECTHHCDPLPLDYIDLLIHLEHTGKYVPIQKDCNRYKFDAGCNRFMKVGCRFDLI